MIVRVPPESAETSGACAAAKDRRKLAATIPPMMRLVRVGGITTQMNIPYSATESAESAAAGSTSPAATPSAVPTDHAGRETASAP